MERKTGQINVNTENIFPIIRKWLYSDQDIFLRELVSNATDAIRKHSLLTQMGEAEPVENESYEIHVTLDQDAGTLTVSDNGLGMDAEEIDKFINQIAFSGAMDFVSKYKDKGAQDGIIGHFGLGFYSAFMVADKVEISSLSYQPGAEPAHWESAEGTDFAMETGTRTKRGSDIILTLNEEAREQLDAAKIREILHKYCQFMPYPIYFHDPAGEAQAKADREKRWQDNVASWEKRKKEAEDKGEEFSETRPELYEPAAQGPINDTAPLWTKAPKDCTDEEYKEFYRKTFNDYREPLFWVHLNMDYPTRVKGILYFPQAENTYETFDGRVKIYNNQVFVADNIKEVIPDFLFLLKGCLDCPDIPLNVSRSFLQNDAYVKKLSEHIVRKVADRLTRLFENERSLYEGYWKDIKVFVKYGSLRDEKFYERVKDALLFETTDGAMKTVSELGDKIWYTTDQDSQVPYIRRAKAKGHEVVIMDHELDNSFMSMLEYKTNKVKFQRIDSEVEGEEGITEHKDKLEKLFRDVTGQSKLKLEVRSLGEDEQPVVISETEESRRMQEMRRQFERMQGSGGDMDWDEMFPADQTLIANTDSPLISRLAALDELPGKEEETKLLAEHTYDLARLAHGSLKGDDLAAYISRSVKLLNQQK